MGRCAAGGRRHAPVAHGPGVRYRRVPAPDAGHDGWPPPLPPESTSVGLGRSGHSAATPHRRDGVRVGVRGPSCRRARDRSVGPGRLVGRAAPHGLRLPPTRRDAGRPEPVGGGDRGREREPRRPGNRAVVAAGASPGRVRVGARVVARSPGWIGFRGTTPALRGIGHRGPAPRRMAIHGISKPTP